MNKFRVVLTLFAFASVGVYSQPQKSKTAPPEIVAKRPECGILLPERDERHDVARLIRADQFLDCERDGFPKQFAPPWKEQDEAEKKLGDACGYFIAKSVRDYPKVGQANLQLASDRCHLNVMSIILEQLVKGVGSSKE